MLAFAFRKPSALEVISAAGASSRMINRTNKVDHFMALLLVLKPFAKEECFPAPTTDIPLLLPSASDALCARPCNEAPTVDPANDHSATPLRGQREEALCSCFRAPCRM